MKKLSGPTDNVKIGGENRVLNVDMPAGSDFPEITYSDAKAALEGAMKILPAIASAEETGIPHAMAARLAPLEEAGKGYSIYLDELVDDPGPASSPPLSATVAARAGLSRLCRFRRWSRVCRSIRRRLLMTMTSSACSPRRRIPRRSS